MNDDKNINVDALLDIQNLIKEQFNKDEAAFIAIGVLSKKGTKTDAIGMMQGNRENLISAICAGMDREPDIRNILVDSVLNYIFRSGKFDTEWLNNIFNKDFLKANTGII